MVWAASPPPSGRRPVCCGFVVANTFREFVSVESYRGESLHGDLPHLSMTSHETVGSFNHFQTDTSNNCAITAQVVLTPIMRPPHCSIQTPSCCEWGETLNGRSVYYADKLPTLNNQVQPRISWLSLHYEKLCFLPDNITVLLQKYLPMHTTCFNHTYWVRFKTCDEI